VTIDGVLLFSYIFFSFFILWNVDPGSTSLLETTQRHCLNRETNREREKTGEEGSRITGAVTSKVPAAEVAGDEMLGDAREEMLGDPGAPPESSRPADEVSYGPFSPLSPPPPKSRAPLRVREAKSSCGCQFFCSLGFIICLESRFREGIASLEEGFWCVFV
jgi:hypothetical protein